MWLLGDVKRKYFSLPVLVFAVFPFLLHVGLGNLNFAQELALGALDKGLGVVPAGTHDVNQVAEPFVAFNAFMVFEEVVVVHALVNRTRIPPLAWFARAPANEMFYDSYICEKIENLAWKLNALD